MKKNWTNPEISSLEITETAGGPLPNEIVDGEIWYDKDQDRWNIPVGEPDDFSKG